ncbi:MAG: hypothetical protein ACLPPV_20680 [Candidatus Korobacteraceae bacterium]
MTLLASLRLLIVSTCAGLLLLTPAAAQIGGSTPVVNHPKELYSFEHYIHAVPRSPGDYQPITAEERLTWFTRETVGPKSLTAGLFSSAIGTAMDSPHEYGPHWDGFAQRYGMRMTGISTGNAIEASLGAVWGEDPRYFRTVHHPFGDRVKNVVDLTFRAYRPDGERHLACARFVAEFGNNFLSNTWRVPSDSDWQRALIRTAEGFGGRALSNAFSEFVPAVWRRVRHKPDLYPADARNP